MVKKSILGLVVVLVAVGGFFASQARAMGLVAGNENGNAAIAVDQTIDGSAYLASKTVTVDGTVKGDLYCAGSDLVVNGTVEGDVLCVGSNLTLGGTVMGDVRLAGSNVTLKGAVKGNATVAGSNVNLTKGASVGGDLTGGAATLIVDGNVGRDMLIGSSTTSIGGMVGRDVTAGLESLSFGEGAKIGGNLTYESKTQSSIPAGVVAGETKYSAPSEHSSQPTPMSPIVLALGSVATLIIMALLVTAVVPKYVHEAASVPFRTIGLAFLAGFATTVLAPIVAVILMMTVVGIPAGLVLLLAWALYFALSGVFFAYYLGTVILKKRATNAFLVVLVGVVVLAVVLVIPIVNVVALLATVFVGMGLQVMQLRHQFGKKPYTIA